MCLLFAGDRSGGFLPFRPGLVGGHCIGVHPYYLAHKALEVNFDPLLILSGRYINENMANYFGHEIIKSMVKNRLETLGAEILILGLSFKTNVSDTRNSKVLKLCDFFHDYGLKVSIFDPLAVLSDDQNTEYFRFYSQFEMLPRSSFSVIVWAVEHDILKSIPDENIQRLARKKHIVYSLDKGILSHD